MSNTLLKESKSAVYRPEGQPSYPRKRSGGLFRSGRCAAGSAEPFLAARRFWYTLKSTGDCHGDAAAGAITYGVEDEE